MRIKALQLPSASRVSNHRRSARFARQRLSSSGGVASWCNIAISALAAERRSVRPCGERWSHVEPFSTRLGVLRRPLDRPIPSYVPGPHRGGILGRLSGAHRGAHGPRNSRRSFSRRQCLLLGAHGRRCPVGVPSAVPRTAGRCPGHHRHHQRDAASRRSATHRQLFSRTCLRSTALAPTWRLGAGSRTSSASGARLSLWRIDRSGCARTCPARWPGFRCCAGRRMARGLTMHCSCPGPCSWAVRSRPLGDHSRIPGISQRVSGGRTRHAGASLDRATR